MRVLTAPRSPPGFVVGAVILVAVGILCYAVNQYKALLIEEKKADGEPDRVGLVAPR